MCRRKTLFLVGVIWGCSIAAAFAGEVSGVRTVYRHSPSIHGQTAATTHRVFHSPGKRRVYLVMPAASTDKATPDEGLAEMIVVHQRVLFDPQADYYRQGENRIDEGHHLPATQRLYRKLATPKAYTVRRGARPMHLASKTIRPRMIITKPDMAPPRPNELHVAAN